jgi:protein-S-isoprenylcysteine O-methyltransferase Ste14
MSAWYAKVVIVIATVLMIAIRAPHGRRSRTLAVVKSGKGPLEVVLLTLAWIAFLVPLLWAATPWLSFADYRLYPLPLVVGTVLLALGLWLFYRSHADLGTNWSVTLEIRESHRLITAGIYRRVRHPMYSAFLVYALGQALVIPNWIAGPCYAAAMLLLVSLRLGPEETLMRERFKGEYDAYVARSKRLIPGVW